MYVNPNGIRRGTWMGHGDHDIVGTMDPHGDGHVMVGYEVRVIRVPFTSLPVRGMLLERARGRRMAGRARGGGAQNLS